MSKRKRPNMGRGLETILPPNFSVEKTESSEIPIAHIETNPFQPRQDFDPTALEDLANSIRVHGIIQPLTVRKLSDNQYQRIAVERRWRASKLAKLKTVPAFVRTADDEQMLEMALIENIQREDLNPIEIALSYSRLIEELKLTQEEVADKVGKARSSVTNYLSLLKFAPDIQEALRSGKLSQGHAKPLKGLKDFAQQSALLKEILEKDLSVRQVEEKVRDLREGTKAAPKKDPAPANVHLKAVAKKFEDKFGNKVRLAQKSDGKGEIVIPFASNDDLDRILEILDL